MFIVGNKDSCFSILVERLPPTQNIHAVWRGVQHLQGHLMKWDGELPQVRKSVTSQCPTRQGVGQVRARSRMSTVCSAVWQSRSWPHYRLQTERGCAAWPETRTVQHGATEYGFETCPASCKCAVAQPLQGVSPTPATVAQQVWPTVKPRNKSN